MLQKRLVSQSTGSAASKNKQALCAVFAHNLRQHMQQGNLSNKALARRARCSVNTVKLAASGKSLPSWEVLVGLCEALNRLPSDLLSHAR